MRINDHQVIQLIDAADRAEDRLVFVDDSDGTEFVIAKADWSLMFKALTYLTTDPGPSYTIETITIAGNTDGKNAARRAYAEELINRAQADD